MKIRNLWITLVFIATGAVATAEKPDVVFIIVDDLNDYLGYLGGHPQVISPNLDKLADESMIFPQAYANSPQCRPSRESLLHGIHAINTGMYFNARSKVEQRRIGTPTMQQFFMDNGYRVVSGGKVDPRGPGRVGDVLFDRPGDPKPPKGALKYARGGRVSDGYPLDAKDEEMSDYKVASWAIEQWNEPTDKPVFMSIGFYRPHRPLQVPKKYFDLYPIESIQRPAEPVGEDDWDDMPEFAKKLARSFAHKSLGGGMSNHEWIVENNIWEETLQAYLASVTFVDLQIGRLIEALRQNPRGRETIIMLVSDHGWHLGEKKHWSKGAIWEQTTRIPFIVSAPGVQPGSVSTQPVSLIDVYPSLVDLAGLETPDWLNGTSIKPQIADPASPRPPAISSYGAGNTSIRTERWRYIRYEDGSEELYDHKTDQNEWHNLATNPEYDAVKKELAAMIPKDQHPGLKVQDWFDAYQK